MSATAVTALYWLAIPLGFGLALLALGCIAQFVSWSSAAWHELSEFDKPYSVTPSSMRDTDKDSSTIEGNQPWPINK